MTLKSIRDNAISAAHVAADRWADWTPPSLQSHRMRRRAQFRRARHAGARILASTPMKIAAASAAAYGLYRFAQWMREERLNGQVVLIAGGSRGLGYLLAHEFAKKGCRIAICGRDADSLERADEHLEMAGAEVLALQCDVTDPDALNDMVQGVTRHFGRIDILVNNAGTIQVGPVDTVTEDDFRHAMDVMFWAPLRATLAVLPQMRERRRGRIVNITSIGGMVSVPHTLPYNCAKFAAIGLSQGLHAELARHGICVTTIVPGLLRVGSHFNAEFRGDAEKEYQWFSVAATMPGLSMNGPRAARQVVRATQRGAAMCVLGMPAAVLERLHGVAPGAVACALGLVNRALPDILHHGNGSMRGREVADRLDSRLFDAITSAGVSAAEQTNQFRH